MRKAGEEDDMGEEKQSGDGGGEGMAIGARRKCRRRTDGDRGGMASEVGEKVGGSSRGVGLSHGVEAGDS